MMDDIKLEWAWKHYYQGRHDAAIEQLKSILGNDPQLAVAHALLAACLLAKSRIYAAEYEIKIAMELEPENPFYFLVRARVAFMKNQFNLALEFCDEALSLDPTFVDAYLLKNDVELTRGNSKQALHFIRMAAELEPNNLEVAIAFGELYFSTGDYAKSECYAREVLAENAQHEEANVLIGNIYLAQGNVADAEYHAKFAISVNPDSERALRLFCNIKLRKNFFLGIWWRFNSWAATMSQVKASLVLITAFLFFNILAQILEDISYKALSSFVSYAWLALVVYSWVGIPMYYRALKKELSRFAFNPDF